MLDTSMNLLATLGGVMPPAPGLGAQGGISQPRFDALLLEISKNISENGKAQEEN